MKTGKCILNRLEANYYGLVISGQNLINFSRKSRLFLLPTKGLYFDGDEKLYKYLYNPLSGLFVSIMEKLPK